MASKDAYSIKVCSFNCNSVRKKVDIIRELMKAYDVIMLQEIILLDEDSNFIHKLHKQFDAYILPSKYANGEQLRGRPSGGLAFLWRKSLCLHNIGFSVTSMNDNFLVTTMNYNLCSSLSFVCVYLPCEDGLADTLTEYSHLMGELQAIIRLVIFPPLMSSLRETLTLDLVGAGSGHVSGTFVMKLASRLLMTVFLWIPSPI